MPPRDLSATLKGAAVPAVGAGLAIALMELLAKLGGLPLGSLPFVTSIVLVIAAPRLPASQPRAIVLGHLLCTLSGFACLHAFGSGDASAAVAVGLSVLAMVLAGALHPPAAINAFVVVTQALGPRYLLVPVATGSVILVAYAWGYHWLTLRGGWPGTRPK